MYFGMHCNPSTTPATVVGVDEDLLNALNSPIRTVWSPRPWGDGSEQPGQTPRKIGSFSFIGKFDITGLSREAETAYAHTTFLEPAANALGKEAAGFQDTRVMSVTTSQTTYQLYRNKSQAENFGSDLMPPSPLFSVDNCSGLAPWGRTSSEAEYMFCERLTDSPTYLSYLQFPEGTQSLPATMSELECFSTQLKSPTDYRRTSTEEEQLHYPNPEGM
eukprot:jgi/Botrbrau1/18948/Bobra.0905s0001.2